MVEDEDLGVDGTWVEWSKKIRIRMNGVDVVSVDVCSHPPGDK